MPTGVYRSNRLKVFIIFCVILEDTYFFNTFFEPFIIRKN